jgi:hypothetical protein
MADRPLHKPAWQLTGEILDAMGTLLDEETKLRAFLKIYGALRVGLPDAFIQLHQERQRIDDSPPPTSDLK